MAISYIINNNINISIIIFMQGIYNYSRARLWQRIMQHLVYSVKYFAVRIN